jgi:hypothetical protein
MLLSMLHPTFIAAISNRLTSGAFLRIVVVLSFDAAVGTNMLDLLLFCHICLYLCCAVAHFQLLIYFFYPSAAATTILSDLFWIFFLAMAVMTREATQNKNS